MLSEQTQWIVWMLGVGIWTALGTSLVLSGGAIWLSCGRVREWLRARRRAHEFRTGRAD